MAIGISDALAPHQNLHHSDPPRRLSLRELEVLAKVADGLSDKEIAGQLGISPKTVRNHLTLIFSKLQAGNRVQAVLKALRKGLLTVTD